MRACPKCGRTYQDEYNFCLVDGTLLSFASDANKTEVFNYPDRIAADSVPTVDSHKTDEPLPTVRVDTPETEKPLPTIAAFTPKPISGSPPEKKRNVPLIILNVVLGVIGLVIILIIIAGAIVGFVQSSREQNSTIAGNKTPNRTATPTPKPTETPTITPTPTPDPTPTKPIVIPNPTLDPRTVPAAQMPNMEGEYDLRAEQSDIVIMNFEVYDQDGTDFYIENTDLKLYGTAHLDRTDKGEYVGYVVWENSAGDKDREIMFICAEWRGLCGKLPFQAWSFVATKNQ